MLQTQSWASTCEAILSLQIRFIYPFVYLKGRKNPPICWFISQTFATDRPGPESPPWSLTCVPGTQTVGPSFSVSPGSRAKAEELGFEQVLQHESHIFQKEVPLCDQPQVGSGILVHVRHARVLSSSTEHCSLRA